MKNPFVYGEIVTDKDFTNRTNEINEVSERTARNDIADLCEKKVLKRTGATISLRYILSSAIFGNLWQHSAIFGNQIRRGRRGTGILGMGAETEDPNGS